jgi:hypothetical protein
MFAGVASGESRLIFLGVHRFASVSNELGRRFKKIPRLLIKRRHRIHVDFTNVAIKKARVKPFTKQRFLAGFREYLPVEASHAQYLELVGNGRIRMSALDESAQITDRNTNRTEPNRIEETVVQRLVQQIRNDSLRLLDFGQVADIGFLDHHGRKHIIFIFFVQVIFGQSNILFFRRYND